MKTFLNSLTFASFFIGSSVVADPLLEKNILNNGVTMYSQVTHTGNVVFINEENEVFYPCRCRQIKGEPPCCSDPYPSLGFLYKRHSQDVVELGKGKGFWFKFDHEKNRCFG